MILVSFPQKEYNPLILQCHLSGLTSCTHAKSNLYLVNSPATVVSDPDLHKLLTFHVPNIMPLFQFLGCIKLQPRMEAHESISKQGQFLQWEVSTSPNLQAAGPSLVCCPRLLFNIFAATLHIGGRSSISNLRKRHAVVTGTHLP